MFRPRDAILPMAPKTHYDAEHAQQKVTEAADKALETLKLDWDSSDQYLGSVTADGLGFTLAKKPTHMVVPRRKHR